MLLDSGDHVVCSDDGYGGVARHFNTILAHYGLRFTYVDTSDGEGGTNVPVTQNLTVDCTAPTAALVTIIEVQPREAIIGISLDEPASVTVMVAR